MRIMYKRGLQVKKNGICNGDFYFNIDSLLTYETAILIRIHIGRNCIS